MVIVDELTGMEIKLTELIETCGGCPSQWDARTDRGESLYIRYRWGSLSVEVTMDGETLRPESIEYGDGLQGVASFDELKDLVARSVVSARVEKIIAKRQRICHQPA